MAEMIEYEVVRDHLGDKVTDTGMVGHFFTVGDPRLADPAIVAHLVGTVLIDPKALRSDGPTVEEYVNAGYRAENYPPRGYAARSSAEEIAAAVNAQAEADELAAAVNAQAEADELAATAAAQAEADELAATAAAQAEADTKSEPPLEDKSEGNAPANKAAKKAN